MYMMVVIFTDVLFGGLGYCTLQPHCASKMASVPRLNLATACCQVFVYVAKTRMGKDVVQGIE